MCFRQSHLLQADAVDGVHEHLGRHHKLTLRLQRCDELAAIHVLRKHLLQCKTDSTCHIPVSKANQRQTARENGQTARKSAVQQCSTE